MITFSKLVAVRGQLHNVLGNKLVLHGFGGQPQIAGLKTVEERIGVPLRPKRPLVPFMRFYKEIRPDLVQRNPSTTMGNLAQLAAARWKEADQGTKDRLNDEFRRDQELFLKEIARYQNGLTDEQREKVKQMKLLISEKRKSREKRQKAREMGKPKHPVPAFTQFLTEQTTKVDKSKVVFREFAVKMGEQWRTMPEADKNRYLAKYKQDMAAYKKDIEKWEEKMIKAGNQELVRRKSLMETGATAPAKPKGAAAKKDASSKSVPATKTTRLLLRRSTKSVVAEGEQVLAKGSGNLASHPQTADEGSAQKVEQVKEIKQEEGAKETKRGVRKFLKFF